MRALDLFCCSGGLAAGFREAGLHFDIAIDFDPNACASYEANLGQRPIQIDAHELLRMVRAGWTPGPLDLLCADPPCSPWSRAGKRQGLDDARDMLRPTVELIALLRPRAYLIGNIPGLQDATHLPIVQELIGGLAREGYCVRDYAALDAVGYGVPQFRVRPFWYGHRGGPCIAWPARTHGDPKLLAQGTLLGERLLPWVTCREALGHLPIEEIGRPVHLRHEGKRAAPRHPHSEADAPARAVTSSDGGGQKRTLVLDVRGLRGRTPQSERIGDPRSPSKTIDTRPARVGTGDAQVLAWSWDRPATTIDTRDVLAPYGRDGRSAERGGEPQREHPNAIFLSEKAAAILQGFGEGWIFAGKTKKVRWSQIGQAVPPPLGAAIGRSVARAIGEPVRRAGVAVVSSLRAIGGSR